MTTQKFFIEGMTCSACSSGIERSLRRKDFVKDINVQLSTKTATVVFDEDRASLEKIFSLITKLGYTPILAPTKTATKQNLWVVILLTSVLVYLAMGDMVGLPQLFTPLLNNILQCVIAIVIMCYAHRFYIHGFKAIVNGMPNMESLIALSTSASLIYSLYSFGSGHLYFESIGVILCLVMVGKRIEERSKEEASNAISTLLREQPTQALRIENGVDVKIPIESIGVGDILKILPGMRIPVDGIISSGIANIDESMLTGEVLPVEKKHNDKLFAGSLNTHTSFLMQSTSTSEHSSLKALIQLIEQASQSKTKLTQIADKIAAFFVPIIIVIAIASGVLWTLVADFQFAFEIAVAVLVVSCPCALGLATPMSIMIGSNLAAKRGLFFRSAAIMENARLVDVICFDKTGTLTNKNLEITAINAIETDETTLLTLMASIEQESEHLIATAIVHAAKSRGLELFKPQSSKIHAGYGIEAVLHNKHYKLGNAEFVGTNEQSHVGIHVFLACDGKILGNIVLFDNLKKGAKDLIAYLKRHNFAMHIISGDNQANVQKIAHELDIPFTSQATPHDKLNIIRNLEQNNKRVMMVGDGINDAAALAASTVSISFTGASDVSYQSAGIIVCNDTITNVAYAIAHAKAVANNIKQNLFWAFCYNTISIPIACGALAHFGILLNPMIAAAAMCLSSLSVVANAQRLKYFTFDIKE